MRATTAVLGVGLVLVTLVMGACMVKLHDDIARLQTEVGVSPAPNSGTSQTVTCGQLQHVRLTVHGRTARCSTR